MGATTSINYDLDQFISEYDEKSIYQIPPKKAEVKTV